MNHTRYHGLDALRAFAMLLGIALHGGMSYIGSYLKPEEKGGWPYDHASSVIVLLLILWIHAWRMQIFFLMAGFFAHLVIQRRGLNHFVHNRFRRVFIPFVVGLLILLPLTIGILAYGAWRTDTLNESSGSGGFPLIHLWFLYYLLGFYGITVLACWAARRRSAERLSTAGDRVLRSVMVSPWRIVGLALPTMLLRTLPRTEDVTLFGPNPRYFLYQSFFFGLGWMLYRQPDLLNILNRRRVWGGYLLIGTLVIMPLVVIAGDAVSEQSLAYNGLYALLTWSLALGLIGLCNALNDQARGWVVYLTDAAYWVYLAHMPIVILLNIWLIGLPWAALIKFVMVCAGSTAFLLATYQWGVRYTFIGKTLNGPRQRAAA